MTVLEAVNGGAVTKYNLIYLGIPGAPFWEIKCVEYSRITIKFQL